jgi:DNA-binding response OmpR family regulator
MNRIKTLIVEDDRNIVDLYDTGLDENEFDKRYAYNGEEALDIYQVWRPEIILLDILLPVMTGFAVLKEIRKTHLDEKTTIIMSSSLNDSSDIRDCMKLGIQGYIIKPFKLEDLGKRILMYHQGGRTSPLA